MENYKWHVTTETMTVHIMKTEMRGDYHLLITENVYTGHVHE